MSLYTGRTMHDGSAKTRRGCLPSSVRQGVSAAAPRVRRPGLEAVRRLHASRRLGTFASEPTVCRSSDTPGNRSAEPGRGTDRCEPESFDAAVGPGTCVRNGGVTFDKFAERLNP